jgi:hypothetical protein
MKQIRLLVGALALLAGAAAALPAQAGDNNGDFMVRVLATGVLPIRVRVASASAEPLLFRQAPTR